MSENTSGIPPEPPAPGPGPGQPAGRGGAKPMLLGILLGVLTLLVVTVLALFVLGPLFPEAWLFGLPLFFLAYLIVAIVLVARPQTSSLGGGLLIGLGVFVLVGGGACFGLLFVSFGSMA